MSADNIAAVLALVSRQQGEVAEAEAPVPPIGTSPKGIALWYALLAEYEFTLGEMVVLETLVATQTQLDELEAAWRHDGAATTSTGSTGQTVVEPRIQEMRLLRAQIVATMKALNLPADGSQEKRRPGRPTRAEGGGRWGAS